MGFDAQDKELVRLITKLKNSSGKYPAELFAARRQRYLKQMAQISLGMEVGTGLKNVANHAKAPALSSTTSTILEAALVVAIAAEASTVAYFYRDKLAEIFQSIQNREEPKVEQMPSPSDPEQEIQGVTAAPAIVATQPSSVFVPIPTTIESASTPIPDVVQENNTIRATSTPEPNVNNENNTQPGNNGNHYGQTPKPERTKDSKNDNGNNKKDSTTSNNDKPPKDNPKHPKPK
jgi:hypothetical protein